MADPEHLRILEQGPEAFNIWRDDNPSTKPNLIEANLSETDLSGANLNGADLNGAYLRGAYLRGAVLSEADLSGAHLHEANLSGADLSEADLSGANLSGANLSGANLIAANLRGTKLRGAIIWEADLSASNLSGARLHTASLSGTNLSGASLSGASLRKANLREANLSGADLSGANLSAADLREANLNEAILELTTFVETRLEGTNISNSRIYGISAWNLEISQETKQFNLVITKSDEPVITVDNLEVAQFVYLLLNNEKIRDVINTIGEKGVLILGRFTEKRKAVLDAIREKLRSLDFVPMMFDFERPTQRDFTETIKTLAGMSRFIIADITNPKSSPLELIATMPDYMIPFVPIIQEDEEPFAMFQDLQQKYGEWVLEVLKYDSAENLLNVMEDAVVKPALDKADKLLLKKAEKIRERHVKDYLK